MPLFYNQSSPTPTTSNSINNVSINIRDFLLNKNLKSTYPQVSTSINGSPRVGEPVLSIERSLLSSFPHQQMTQDTSTIDVLGSILNGQGLGFNGSGLEPNFDIRSSLAGRILGATGLLNDTKIGTIGAQQLALALANNAAFNVQQQVLGTLNVSDNILGLIKNGTIEGFRPSYQITIPSSDLGQVADYAGKILGFTLPKSYLGDEGSIFQNENGNIGNIERANSMIKNTGKGQVMALLNNVNANIAVNQLNNTFRTGYAPGFTNNKGERKISESNSIIYAFDKEGQNINLLKTTDGIIPDLNFDKNISTYGFKSPEENGTGPSGNQGYDNRKLSDVGFTWTTGTGGIVNTNKDFDEMVGDKKSLMVKTQQLFNSKGMLNIVTNKGDMNKKSSQISQANGGGFSKGSAVLREGVYDDKGRYIANDRSADETYCRSWTTLNRYDKVYKLIRSGVDGITGPFNNDDDNLTNAGDNNTLNGVRKSVNGINLNTPFRETNGGTQGSILDAFGAPHIAPYNTDSFGNSDSPQRYMFSIENLAWSDKTALLPPYEVGAGDLITGKKGRIMWFPPYDISFSENSTVNWESNNFIGRGEPLYTYNNTERTGTLSFKVIVDHSSYTNTFRGTDGPDDNYVASFMAGCVEPSKAFTDKLTLSEASKIEIKTQKIPQTAVIEPEEKPEVNIKFYFPNDNADMPNKYENGLSGLTSADTINYSSNKNGTGYGLGTYPALFTQGIHLKTGWNDVNNYGLNGFSEYASPINFNGVDYWNWRDLEILLPEIERHLSEKCRFCVANVTGFASQQGIAAANKKLIDARANKIIDFLVPKLFLFLPEEERRARFKKKQGSVPDNQFCRVGIEEDISNISCKKDRRAEVTFEYSPELKAKSITPLPDKEVIVSKTQINEKIRERFYNESKFFERLTDEDPFIFDSFREKIKYFHPAFHSMTPEGLNSRLTFLLQCTRQGPTLEREEANNLAFGRAPVCILRIGDFYNTKIVMDNVGIDYEPLVWDLNPEGIGVQPMIANVNISFKFLGGSSLMGPINKLQNALSFNYFANTQVYDPRADYISKEKNDAFLMDGEKSWKNDKTEITKKDLPLESNEDVVNLPNQPAVQPTQESIVTISNNIEDKVVLSKIVIDGYVRVLPNDGYFGLFLNFGKHIDDNGNPIGLTLESTLNKTYKAHVYIISRITNEKTYLGFITAKGDNGIGMIFTSNGVDVNLPFDNWNKRWKIEIPTTPELETKLIGFQDITKITPPTDSYSISVEWETGSKTSHGFDYTHGQ
jgi:hypothetical protein